MLNIRITSSLVKTKKDVANYLLSNKDAVVADISSRWDGKPVNLRDLQASGESEVKVRWHQDRKVDVFPVNRESLSVMTRDVKAAS